jgi:hypothetical protein
VITRRRFLGMLAVLPAVTALAGAGLRLPRREDIVVESDPHLIGQNWYVSTGAPESFSNNRSAASNLSERSLQDMLNWMETHTHRVQPTKLIVPPNLVRAAHDVMHYSSLGFFDRLLWRLARI